MGYVIDSISSAHDETTGAIYPLLIPASWDQIGTYADDSNVAGFNGMSSQQVGAKEYDPAGAARLSQTVQTDFARTAPADSSTISDITKSILGLASAGGSVATSVIQNDTLRSLLASRGLALPAPKPAAASSIPWGPIGLALAVAAAVWKLSQ